MGEESKGKGLGWFVVGAALGAALGILFAPKKGSETREELADWLHARREKGEGILSKLKESVPGKKDQIMAAFKAGKEAYFEAGDAKHTNGV